MMITQQDRNILRDVGREYLMGIAMKSDSLRNKLTFREHVDLCKHIATMPYEDVIAVTITEGIKEFEGKFRKFLKYGFAAIAGLGIGVASTVATGGLALLAPPVAMFVLYIFRKLTDTCSRSCVKIPFSTKRKICRYECQVDACRRIVRDLRSEITKCAGFAKPEKCEKKLRGEYIKWSKRLQQQMIKLHQAKLGTEEKERRKRGKELEKKAKTIAAGYKIPKSQMLNMITEDKRFRQLPFKYHIELYKAVSAGVVEQKKSHELVIKPPKIDPAKEKYARQALYLGLWVIPIPFFNDVVNYLIKKHNFACYGKCVTQRKFSQTLCRHQCSYLSAKYAVQLLNKQLGKCNKANKPVKCKKKILKMLEDWKQREVEAKIKFQGKMRGEIAQAKKREGKI